MKKTFLFFFLFSLSHFAFSQRDTTLTKAYVNDSLYAFLDSVPEKVKIADVTYLPKCSFSHDKTRHSKAKPYYWNCLLRASGKSALPANIKQVKLFILSDTTIYEFTYVQKSLCWNKTTDVYQKPVAVIIEFLDTTTNKNYFVRAKGPFPTKH
jgi:hypothetical protein